MRFRFPHTVPASPLYQAVVPVEIETLATVGAPWKFISRRNRIGWPDMRLYRNVLVEFITKNHHSGEAVSPALFIVKRIKRIKRHWNTSGTGTLVENIERNANLTRTLAKKSVKCQRKIVLKPVQQPLDMFVGLRLMVSDSVQVRPPHKCSRPRCQFLRYDLGHYLFA